MFHKIKNHGKVLKSKMMMVTILMILMIINMVTILMILMIINMVKIAMKWWLQASSFSKELVKCNEHVHTWKPNYFFSTKFAEMCLKDSKTFKTFLKLWNYLELKGKRNQRLPSTSSLVQVWENPFVIEDILVISWSYPSKKKKLKLSLIYSLHKRQPMTG